MFKKSSKLCMVLVLCFVMQLCIGIQSFAAGNGYSVYLNGTKLELKNEPITKNGHVYIPVEDLASASNITIGWKSADVNFKNDDKHALYMIDYAKRTLVYMAADKNVVALKVYPEKLSNKDNYTLPFFENGDWEEFNTSMLGINKAYILDNKVPYISSDVLDKALHFKVTKDDGAKTIKLERAATSSTFDQYCEQLVKNWYDGLGDQDKEDASQRYNDISYDESDSPTEPTVGIIDAFKKQFLDPNNGYSIYNEIAENSAIGDEFVGDTLWIQKRAIAEEVGSAALKGQGYFVKLKVDGFVVEEDKGDLGDSLGASYGLETKFVAKYLVTIAGKQYKINNDDLFGTSEKDYTQFSVDPKTKFKWADSIWTKLDKGELWSGMTMDMAKMILGVPGKTETTSLKGKKYTLWTYRDSDGYLLGDMLYFDNGKLIVWNLEK